MRINNEKYVGILCGSSIHKQVPYKYKFIQWLKPGQYTKILGIPYWSSQPNNQFWNNLYRKIKTKLASWHPAGTLTTHGRVKLANFMVYSIPRYWTQIMEAPKEFPQN
jgi:hypothetical protein